MPPALLSTLVVFKTVEVHLVWLYHQNVSVWFVFCISLIYNLICGDIFRSVSNYWNSSSVVVLWSWANLPGLITPFPYLVRFEWAWYDRILNNVCRGNGEGRGPKSTCYYIFINIGLFPTPVNDLLQRNPEGKTRRALRDGLPNNAVNHGQKNNVSTSFLGTSEISKQSQGCVPKTLQDAGGLFGHITLVSRHSYELSWKHLWAGNFQMQAYQWLHASYPSALLLWLNWPVSKEQRLDFESPLEGDSKNVVSLNTVVIWLQHGQCISGCLSRWRLYLVHIGESIWFKNQRKEWSLKHGAEENVAQRRSLLVGFCVDKLVV